MEKLFDDPRIKLFEEELVKYSTLYNYDTKEYPIEVILHKYNPDPPFEVDLIIPDYQRSIVWSKDMQSEFIESLFLWMPIQPIFVSTKDDDGKLEIIDGLQRISAINAFVKEGLVIQNVKKLTYLNGLHFLDLPLARQRKFKLIPIRFHNISDKADLEIRKDIFRRVNKQERLTASEIRKGSAGGEFYGFIQNCAKNVLLKKLCPIAKEVAERGEYEELLLRFFAYTELGLDQKERGQPLLDNYLFDKNKVGFDQAQKQKEYEAMLNFVDIFFANGFKKSNSSDTTPRVRFEAISVGVAYALKEKPDLKPLSMDWINSEEFMEVTTSDSSNNTGRLAKRVNFVKDRLLGIKPQKPLTYKRDRDGLFQQ